MTHRFGLLPHVRNSAASNARAAGSRLSSQFQVAVMGDGEQQGSRLPITATLRGPGDVIGIASGQIARFEPASGQRGFEPNYFPFVEFVDADFPWRYSLGSGNPTKLSPWLALIALKDDEFDLVAQGQAPLPRLMVHSAQGSLPNLSQAWAWAHVQVTLDEAQSKTAEQVLTEDPANGFSRLMCCRRLEPRVRYHLFLVPVYEAGRLAGLGDRHANEAGSALAWLNGVTEAVELPYYAHSEFVTDALADLEQLVRKLRAYQAGEGDKPGAPERASAEVPGYYPDYHKDGASFEIQTALMQADLRPERYQPDPELAQQMATTLTEVITGEGDDPDEDPLVAFPPYGFRFRQEESVSTQRATNGRWFDRLNLDLKMRHAAARGAALVSKNQEEYVQVAWNQYDALMDANQRLRQLCLAEKLADSLARKHLDRIPSDVVTVLAEPMQPYVSVVQDKGISSIAQMLALSGSPAAYATLGLRRLAGKRSVGIGAEGRSIPSPSIKGDLTSSSANVGTPGIARSEGKQRFFAGLHPTGPLVQHYRALFGTAALGPKPNKAVIQVREFRSKTFANALSETMRGLPSLKAGFTVKGRTAQEKKKLDPLWRSPRIPQPMAKALENFSRQAILSNVGDLPDNTVSIFAENRAFIEAFMVGANHAMNDELRWREFPTDMRGTIFDRFWDRGLSWSSSDGKDIAGIHSWTQRLGRNPNPSNTDGNEALVLVIKGDVVRKLGDPIIVVNKGPDEDWAPGDGQDFEPVFFGKMGRETVYFGFDLQRQDVLANPENYRLVIYEPMGRLRFGLDVGNASVRQKRRDLSTLSLNFPMKHRGLQVRQLPLQPGLEAPPPRNAIPDWDDLSWDHVNTQPGDYINFSQTLTTQNGADLWGSGNKTSASLARSFWQKPVAAVLPFERVLP
jgi:hypothetical protein